MMTTRRALFVVLALSAPAAAQPAKVTDVEVPALVTGTADESLGQAADESIDLANIVMSAAKGVTTVQEAPAIVTVITADEIKDRQFQDITEIIDTVPGWQSASIYYSNFPTPLVRGQVQAVQFLHDGVSLFDPFVNVPDVNDTQPLEMIKRLEFITGPGGVLWGSNSLLGILNVITKDAEDVDGVEMGAGVGDGTGEHNYARAYVMGGKSDLMSGTLKLFGHASVETYQGSGLEMPLLLFHDALPQPNSANTYGPLTATDPAQSIIVNLDAKVTYDKLQLRLSAPFGRMYKPFGLSGEPIRDVSGNPNDPDGAAKLNRSDTFDRYAVLEYRTRFAEDKAGITAHVYGIQFVRTFDPLQVLAPSQLLPGGLDFSTDLTSYRVGGAVDGDLELGKQVRLLYGGETFHEWSTADFSTFGEPSNLALLPLLCPRVYDPSSMMLVPVASCPLTFAYPGDRTVLGAYLDPQWRPNKSLIFDIGARVQAAPQALGSLSYSPNITIAGTVVWNFIPNWHLKLNYAEGFRPPVFNNTLSNGEALQIAGNPDLTVETSRALQAEVNARIWKGDRRIRELSFRVDASYTELSNLIQVESGQYQNSGERGLTSAELLATLYIQGGHRIELGYTYLNVDSTDKGEFLSLPNHWFNLTGVWNLVTNHLTATTNLKISGSTEDPNRLVEYRDLMYDPSGMPTGTTTALATDLVLDQLPPIAELSAGLSYTPVAKLAVRATVYDALGGHYYYPDAFFDYEPHLEYLPNPEAGFRAFVSALYQY